MGDDRMFAELMATKDEPASPPPPLTPKAKKVEPERADDIVLPAHLESLGDVGYTTHSYRVTEAELRWLRRFTLRLSERLDRRISHNTLIRVLLRIADGEWRRSPDKNPLLEELFNIKD